MVLIKDKCPLHGMGQLLVLNQLLERTQALAYCSLATQENQSLPYYLFKNNILKAKQIASTAAIHFGIPLLDLNCITKNTLSFNQKEQELIRAYRMLPLFQRENYLYLAVDDPCQYLALKEIQFHTGCEIQVILVETDKLHLLIEQILFQQLDEQFIYSDLENEVFLDLEQLSSEQSLSPNAEAAPLVKFINNILLQAIKQGVSDIHFESYEKEYRIRYRQDGVLYKAYSPPLPLSTRIIARIKVMSNLDLAEKRIPQDGGFKINFSQALTINFRVSICPTIEGEKIVIRLLDSNAEKLKIESLGLSEIQKTQFLCAIKKPQGIILVTGPTGSGKTSTLYSALNLLNNSQLNISTVEDPVEIKISGINQVNINSKTGLTFSEVLRSFLRQDPDVIMLGEIRDTETAEIAVKAAHTGHLVLSTLHTNSACQTLNRLLAMGVPSYNITSSIIMILSQRLVRTLCPHCKALRTDLTPSNLLELGFKEDTLADLKIYKPLGCKHCINGYKGRVGLFELLLMTPSLEQKILAKANSRDILELAKSEGMSTLFQSGLEKVQAGLTSIEELQRVTVE